MSYIKHHPDYDDMVDEQRGIALEAGRLRARALRHPDPRDPDALDEDEMDHLEVLENYEP